MDNRMKWVSAKIRTGWIFLATGVFVAILGRFIEHQYSYLPYNLRIITGLGILLAGIGVGFLVRYWAALKDEQSAKRLTVEERDERTVLIRARAGNRAYWVSTVLVYTGLMWASFAANGGLSDLSGDVLWYFLVAAVLIPFGVYIVSILVDQQNF
jgi:hypothetical protein